MKNYTSILIIVTLILIGFFLFGYVDRSQTGYLNSQQVQMEQSTRGAASIIEIYIREVRRRVDLFAEEEGETIGKLSRNHGG